MSAPSALAPMTIVEALEARRSVRGFLPRPVEPETLRRVFALAQRAPSNCNIQPWRALVASGAAKDRLRAAHLERIRSGVPPNPDYDYPPKFEGEHRRRQVECAAELYGKMGIAREDGAGRLRASLRNFEFFDAPHVAFVGMAPGFGATVALDVGIYLQSLMLAMTAEGIGCCAQGSLRSYPDLVRAEFGVGGEVRILVGLSFGYEDPSVPANLARTTRESVDANVLFKE